MKFLKNNYLIVVIMLLGLFLRVWGIDFGLPSQFHQDEPIVVNHALAYGTGDLNPHFFNIPPMASYILFLLYGIYFFIGMAFGIFSGADNFAFNFLKDPSIFYIIGRIGLGIIPGLLCVIFVYIFAKNIFSKKTGLYSALIMSVCCLNIINSHYAYVDTVMVMFVLLAYNGIFRMIRVPALRNYIIAAIFLGLAIGAKYNAALLGLPFLAHLFIIRSEKSPYGKAIFSKSLWLSFFAAIFVFIAVNPFAILAHGEFWASFKQQAAATWVMGWWHHLSYSLKEGISLPVLLFGIIGLLIVMFKEREKGIVFVSFPIIFYPILVFYSQPFSRYVLVLVPFLSIGVAYFIFEIVWSYRRKGMLKMVLVFMSIILLFPTAIKSIKADMLFCAEDTRAISAHWISNNLPQGSKIACDSTFFRPVLKQPYSQLKNKQQALKNQPEMARLKQQKLYYEIKASDKDYVGYPIYFLSENAQGEGKFLNTVPAIDFDIDSLRNSNIDYVVINYAVTNGKKGFFLKNLKDNSALLKTFSPYRDGQIRYPYDKFESTCLSVLTTEIFSRRYTGPCLEIYKIKR